jgi:squalene-associated FAD-dependent desaturase
MADARGHRHQLVCPDVPPPWNLLAGLLRWSALPVADRLRALRVGPTVQRARRHGAEAAADRVPREQTVEAWLMSIGQSKRLCEWLWHPLTLAALNQSPDVAAAAPFVRVLAELFGREPQASAIGLSRVPLDELYAEPARRFLEARGGAVYLQEAGVVEQDRAGAVTGVRTGRGTITTRHVVSAVPWFAFRTIWQGDVPPPVAGIAANADRMGSSPIVTINLWLDGPAMDVPFMGLVDGPVHWVFDKARICGAGANHLALVTSGADVLAASDNAEVTAQAFGHLCAAVPAARGRRVLRSVVVRERRATFSLAPGGPARPPAQTELPGFVLAGDWTDTGLPATIEGAVLSGHRAADLVLAGSPKCRPPE